MNFSKLAIASFMGVALIGISACSNQSEAQAPEVQSEKAEMETFTTLGVPSGAYVMDKTHGYVTFSYSHFGFSDPQLRFRDVDATLTLDAEHPENSQVMVSIKAASIDSGVDVFDEHLNGEGFFNTQVHPQISFKSTSFTRDSQTTGTMTGALTMMGKTLDLSLDVTLLAAKNHPFNKTPTLGVEARGTLNRSDFDLGKYAPGVSDEVDILVTAEFNKSE